MKRKPDLRERALKAYRLQQQNITGEELAARLKTFPDHAADLVKVGRLIWLAESHRLSERSFAVLQVVARVAARKTMLGVGYATAKEIDFAAGKRRGWCSKRIVDLAARGLIVMHQPNQITFTAAGWALVWEAGLIKPNWRVPA